MEKEKILIIGNGTFGIALAHLLSHKGMDVTIWGRNSATNDMLRRDRTTKNIKDKNFKLHSSAHVIDDISLSQNYDIWIFAVSSKGVYELANRLKAFYKNQIVVNASKGMEIIDTLTEILSTKKIVELSGPTHAEEIIASKITLCVVGSRIASLSKKIQTIFSSDIFRVYINNDIYGIEIAGSLKNIIAIACGMCDALGFGDNAKSALITRGLAEIKRLGMAMGTSETTYNGLAGMGDLIVTCSSLHSRNRRYGFLIGSGLSHEDAIKEINMVVEGLNSIYQAHEKASEFSVETPIINEMYEVIKNGKSPLKAIESLMTRELKFEK